MNTGGKKASDFVSHKLFDYVLAFTDSEATLEGAVLKAFTRTELEFLEIATKASPLARACLLHMHTRTHTDLVIVI